MIVKFTPYINLKVKLYLAYFLLKKHVFIRDAFYPSRKINKKKLQFLNVS